MRDAQGARGAHHSVVELLLLAGEGAGAGQHDAIHRCAIDAGHAARPAGRRGPLHAHGRLRHQHRRAHALLVLLGQRCGGGMRLSAAGIGRWLQCCARASATGNARRTDELFGALHVYEGDEGGAGVHIQPHLLHGAVAQHALCKQERNRAGV